MCPMPAKGPCWGKLPQLMPDHILANVYGDEFLSVMDRQRVPHEFRENDGPPRPSLDDLSVLGLTGGLHLLEKVVVSEGAFLD